MLSLISTMAFFFLPLFLVPFLAMKLLYTSKPNQPPSPRKLPVIGNLHQLGLSPHRSLQSLSKQYGPLMLLHLGNVPVLIASSSEAAREIMKTHDLIFSSRPKLSIPDRLFYGGKDIAFAPYGEYWRNVRSMCVLHLLSNKRVQSFRNIREEELSLMINRIKKASSSSSSGLVNLTDEINLLTNDIVCRVALGRKYSNSNEKMGKKFMRMLRDMAALLGTFDVGDYLPWLAWMNYFNGLDGRVKKLHQEFDEFFEGVLQEAKKIKKIQEGEGGSKNLVEILVQIQRENTLGFDIQDENIKAITWDMFSAGIDTTNTVLNWTMSELLFNPSTMHTLQKEVRRVGEGKSELCEDDLAKMSYLKAVVKETLRLHAPVPLLVPRKATQDIDLMGYNIKAGTQVFINAWAIGRDPTYWENPEEFRPERFLENNAIKFKGFDFEFIPFGMGRRGCPGSTFALVIIEIAVAKLLHEFDFKLPDGLKREDLDMSEANGITVQRRCPLIVSTSTACGKR